MPSSVCPELARRLKSLVLRRRAPSNQRAAQPFNQPDCLRQPVISTLGIARLRIQMQGNRGAHSLRCWATATRAARPASLASSARTESLEANHLRAPACSAKPKTIGTRGSIHVVSGAATLRVRSFHSPRTQDTVRVSSVAGCKKSMFCKACSLSCKTQALRRSARPNTGGRAGTSCCAARAGGLGLLASVVTQRTMQAGSGVLRPLPNPSIERTCPGKPGHASHLKR